MNPDRREFLTLGIGALALAALPPALRRPRSLVRRRIPVMGTVAEVAVPSRDVGWAQRAIDDAFGELRRVESTMTRFRPDSDVGVLNSGNGTWASVSHDTGEVLVDALRWARISGGRFDPCLGRATELWDVMHRTEPPMVSAVVDWADRGLWSALDVELDASDSRARLNEPSASVDLGGIAKGFAVDAAAEALRRHGVMDGLVNIGGDLVALGVDVTGDPWRIGVRSPKASDGLVAEVSISDEAVATSGDYVRFFQHRGRRYHHLLDPETGAPRRTPTRSLTVRAELCQRADAAATALFGAPTGVVERVLANADEDIRIIHHLQDAKT